MHALKATLTLLHCLIHVLAVTEIDHTVTGCLDHLDGFEALRFLGPEVGFARVDDAKGAPFLEEGGDGQKPRG